MTKKLVYKLIECAREIKAFLRIPFQMSRIGEIINKQSYYPELSRKNKFERLRDNIEWLFKDKLVNIYYTSYGLDVRDFRDKNDFIPQRQFIIKRNAGNQKLITTISGDYNYIVLLRDKYVFSAYLSSTIGPQYVVESVGIIDKDLLYTKKSNCWQKSERITDMTGQWVFKVIDGECGEGIYLVTIKDGKIIIDNEGMLFEEFSNSVLGNARWLIQPVIEQHPALKAFGTKSVNTIRIITIKGKSGGISVFNAFLRLGASKDSFVDNRAIGGYGIGIDIDSGKLMKYGFQHDQFGVKTDKHPLSGILFEGYQIPFWKETIELIEKAHRQFYEIQSIGWDVAISENGPILLEGNDDWEIGGPQDTAGGLRKRWHECVDA